MRLVMRVLLVAAFGLAVSGCSKCGDWYFGATQHSCHNESSVK